MDSSGILIFFIVILLIIIFGTLCTVLCYFINQNLRYIRVEPLAVETIEEEVEMSTL